MQNEILADELLKMDRRGRVRVSKERREALLDEFERCGVSAVQFTARVGVNYQTFAVWRQKRRRQRDGAEPAAAALPIVADSNGVRWAQATVGEVTVGGERAGWAGTEAGALMVHLPGGARMEVLQAGQLPLAAGLLRMLQKREGCAQC